MPRLEVFGQKAKHINVCSKIQLRRPNARLVVANLLSDFDGASRCFLD